MPLVATAWSGGTGEREECFNAASVGQPFQCEGNKV